MRRLLENLKLAVLKVKKWELIVEIMTKLCPKQQVSLGSSGHEEARHVVEEWMKRVGLFGLSNILFPTSSTNTFRAVQTQSVQRFLFISTVCVFSSDS